MGRQIPTPTLTLSLETKVACVARCQHQANVPTPLSCPIRYCPNSLSRRPRTPIRPWTNPQGAMPPRMLAGP
ncbi:hypothetical protein CsatB_020605 [Cannabis sativa]